MPRTTVDPSRISTEFVLIDSDGQERYPYRERSEDGTYKFVTGTGQSGGKRVFFENIEDLVREAVLNEKPVTAIRLDGTRLAGVSLRTLGTVKAYKLAERLWPIIKNARCQPLRATGD